jgi:hypothetical protein
MCDRLPMTIPKTVIKRNNYANFILLCIVEPLADEITVVEYIIMQRNTL